MNERICPNCGNNHFFAHQVCRMDVIVDSDGQFESNLNNAEQSIYDSEPPYGHFVCTKCGAEFEDVEDMDRPYQKRQEIFYLLDKDHGYICASILIKNSTEQAENTIKHLVSNLKKTATRETFYLQLLEGLRNFGFEAEEVDCKSISI